MMQVTESEGERLADNLAKMNKMDYDFLSAMPNEILVNILSRLTIKEAGRTSVLSNRWKDLWTLFFGIVEFDHSVKLYEMRRQFRPPLKKCVRFVSEWERFMANLERVLLSLQNPTLEELRIRFDLGNPLKIAELVQYAAEKDVKVLDLDCSYHYHAFFVTISERVRNVLARGYQMKSLKVLRLVCVEVKGKVLEYFLENCPFLETIYVRDSRCLDSLKVRGDGLRLKTLELVECNLHYFYISAGNLESLTYIGEPGQFFFESMPSLVEAKFGARYSSYIQVHVNTADIHQLLSRLRVLKLNLFSFDTVFAEEPPVFHNVEHLELGIPQGISNELNRPISLLSAFPSIRLLKLRFRRFRIRPLNEEPWTANMETELPNLRELEVSGCRRDNSQNELITTIVQNAPNLSKILVDPVSSFYDGRSEQFRAMIKSQRRDFNLWFADGLREQLPPHVEVVVL